MPSENLDIIDRIGRTLVVGVLVYLTTFVLAVGIGAIGASLHPLLAILLGLITVYAGFSIYYYYNPQEAGQ